MSCWRRAGIWMLILAVCVCTSAHLRLSAHGEADVAEIKEGVQIVCTSFPCYDFARAAMGDAAEVQLLIKPGSEVHNFDPTPADMLLIAQCDLFVYVGGESDAWARDLLSSFGADAPETICFFDCVDLIEEEDVDAEAHEHADEVEYDEHIWTSPQNAMRMIDALAEKLCAMLPERADTIAQNAKDYSDEIGEIDAQIREIVRNAARRELIFADRFPFLYFVREYGLTYAAAFSGCAAECEPSARILADLMDRIVEDEIPVVYIIELSNGRTAHALAEETGVEVETLYSMQNISEGDFATGMNYADLMRRNVEALRRGLN